MAFNISLKVVENNKDFPTKAAPWRCNQCNKTEDVLLRMKIDYDTLILCKKCLASMKKLITDKEKELKDGNKLS